MTTIEPVAWRWRYSEDQFWFYQTARPTPDNDDPIIEPLYGSPDAMREALERLRIEAPDKYLLDHQAAPGGPSFADKMYADGMRAAFTMALAALAQPQSAKGK